jgi:hypothetical protein
MLGLVFVLVGIIIIFLIVNHPLIKLKMKTKELNKQNGRKRDLIIFLPIAGRKFFLRRPKKRQKN